MNNIDITKIAVKFDPDNTKEELFNSVVEKFVELGYSGSLEYAVYGAVAVWPILAVDNDLVLSVTPLRSSPQYTILSPQEFLALGNASQKQHPVEQPVVDNTAIVAEWLDKLQYVFDNETTIQNFDYSRMILETDFGDVRGAKEIVEFIDSRHNQLTSERKAKEKQELEAKRQKLMDELSEIDQQLGLYE